ncbi:cytochrome c oxidase subunit 6B1-like protein [Leptotrombidium deliense]|uniref:Cytochrome c oxidase subunit n=1 Tax=Leptotrombidium deliense TaxID=299467 RepID=A0A443S3G0_9ACAR|nr:cytochrome c oxidase subunit 6B1-like protein [Leptotrombidium deliense]
MGWKDLSPEEKRAKLAGPPYDPRFPNQNQTRNCYQNYLDYHRCIKIKGQDYKPCEWYRNAYVALCPDFWYQKWDEQREKGTFAGRI